MSLGPVQESIVRALYERRHGGYVSSQDLVQAVYHGKEPEFAESAIRKAIHLLRPWLAERNVALVNAWGRGYRIERMPLHADEVAA